VAGIGRLDQAPRLSDAYFFALQAFLKCFHAHQC
jgi:hypothetical protein